MKPKARKFRIKRAAPGTTLRTETAAAPDDEMVMNRDADGLCGLDNLVRHLNIGLRGGGIARGVVMDKDDRAGVKL